MMSRKDLAAHLVVCPAAVVQCAMGPVGCQVRVRRDELPAHEAEVSHVAMLVRENALLRGELKALRQSFDALSGRVDKVAAAGAGYVKRSRFVCVSAGCVSHLLGAWFACACCGGCLMGAARRLQNGITAGTTRLLSFAA